MRFHEMSAGWTFVGSILMGAGWMATMASAGGDDAAAAKPEVNGRDAVAAVAPDLPREIVLDMQAGRFAEAAAALAGLKAPEGKEWTADDRAYVALVRSVAFRLGDKKDEARALLEATLKESPEGQWTAKLKGELVAIHLAAGRYADAEKIARSEAERLLEGDRKDRLAGVYREFARRLLDPADPTMPADPAGAYVLLEQARGLAKGEELRASLLLEMGKASQEMGNPAQAIENYQQYLKEYLQGADREAARFALGEAQLATGQPLPARLTWSDLARDLEKQDTKAAQELRGRALFQISRTYGVPTPGDDTSLNLGIASLRRLLEAYPDHPLAVRAAYDIAEANLARGRDEAALEALRAFLVGKGYKASTDEARTMEAQLLMAAQFMVGHVLQGQEKFAEAIEAWRTYLSKYPNGAQSAEAQRAIVDTRLLIAQKHQNLKEYDKARAAWQVFVAENPLDGRVPQILFAIGESWQTEEQYDKAIAAWELLAGKFPGTEPAAHGDFMTASIYEVQKGEPAEAIERFRKVVVEPWASQARQRIAVMETKALTVITPRAFRSGETPQLKITTRNIEKLTLTAYKLDVEAYFRKKQSVANVEALDIGLVQPDHEWTVEVPGYDKFKPIETSYDLPKLEIPGVYVVKVTDEKTLQATTLVLGSDVDAIVKVSRDQLLLFAQDMKTGEGRPNARILVSDGEKVVLDGTTGADGVLLTDWKEPRDPGQQLSYVVLADGHAAGTGLGVPGQVAQGLTARAYIYTDRPAYRPGQTVEVRGVVREIKSGQYDSNAGAEYRLEVFDTRGRTLQAGRVTLSEYGTFHTTLALDSSAPLGAYRVRLFQPGKSDFGGQFEVQAYQLQKIDLTIDLPRTVYFRGEKVEAKVIAKYQYGSPVAGHDVVVNLPDGRTVNGQTNDAGEFPISFSTEGFAEEQALSLMAQLPQDGVAAAAMVQVAIRAFRTQLSTSRDVYLDGESFPLQVTTVDALGEPAGQALTLTVLEQVTQGGRTVERQVSQTKLTTDAKTGIAGVPVKIDNTKGGNYILRVAGTDRFGNPVVEDRRVTISGQEDGQKLRFLADRLNYKVGETAEIPLHSRLERGVALLTWEADRILEYKLVPIVEGENAIKWPVAAAQFPNFTLAAGRMAGTQFHQTQVNLRIERDLKVELKPRKAEVGPAAEVVVDVTTVDQLGKPVAAELSLALIDRALLRLYGDNAMPIGPFFYDQTRVAAFATESTIAFRYQPPTQPVAEAVVEEEEQRAAVALGLELREQVMSDLPAPAAAPMGAIVMDSAGKPMAPGMPGGGGMGGMMGGMGGGVSSSGNSNFDHAEPGQDGYALQLGKRMMAPRSAAVMSDGPRELSAATAFESLARRKAGGGKDKNFAGQFGADRKELRDGETASPRQQYVETAYWNPSVVTGADGKGTVTFTAPTALSDYQFMARGVTGADTLVGQATAGLVVNQDFFVDVRLPSTLTEGDTIRVPVELHHRNVKSPADVVMTVYSGGRETKYPKTVEWKADGVESILFEPITVPAGDVVRVTLEARAGEATDKLTSQTPIRPWGLQIVAGASGTASEDTTVFVELPEGGPYESPEMLIALSPSLRRMVIELALGRDFYPLPARFEKCIVPPVPNTVADRASDALGLAAALRYVNAVGGGEGTDAPRLVERLRSAASELVSLQNDDGGWPWVPGAYDKALASDPSTSALAFWALAEAERLSLVPDPAALDRGANYLTQEFPKIETGNQDTRAFVLHALSTRGKASFEWANALNRERQGLSDAALASLALTFANLNRNSLGSEVLDVLGPRAKTETPKPGARPMVYWDGRSRNPFVSTRTETTALAALAYAVVRPTDEKLPGAIEWLVAHRSHLGWQPHKAKGPALAALGAFYGRGQAANERYRLIVTVNDEEVHRVDVQGQTEGAAITVPIGKLKAGAANRVHFDLEGRGTIGYAVTLTGFTRNFDQKKDAQQLPFGIHRRVYWAPEPSLEGRPLPQGFGVAVNPKTYENTSTQISPGTRITVSLEGWRNQPTDQPVWERDGLVLEEQLPAGTSLVEGSVETLASTYEYRDGLLRFYFAPDQWPNAKYQVFGQFTGKYRALPPKMRGLGEPSRQFVGTPGALAVLAPGEKSSDPYKATPDELYARGKTLFDSGNLTEAGKSLEALWSDYSLRDDVAKDAARMLLTVNIKEYEPRKVVQFFEVLKEKAPELVISFDDIKVVGRAYGDIGEHERAWLVWRATTEASYLEDARIGEVLRQRGQTLDGLAYLLRLWREHPGSAAIQNDFFGLSAAFNDLAARAVSDPTIRRELSKAGVTKPELLGQQVRLIQTFLALAPQDPVADEASLAEVGAFLDLEDFGRVVKLSGRLASIYPKSKFLDSFLYSQALGHFHLGEYDPAIGLAEKIATASYKDAAGAEQPSPNKWEAIYILGQIHDARHQPGKALDYYRQVADRFGDASGAIKELTRKELTVPEVAVVRPQADADAPVVTGVGLRNIGVEPRSDTKPDLTVHYRNLAEIDLKVYAVDLMRLYLTRRNLDGITGIDLAGIHPLVEKTVTLGDGQDYMDKVKELDLPLEKEGAYLVMARGETLYASGIVLVSPLELEVLEESPEGRVRVRVLDARTRAFLPKVQVKVIGSNMGRFVSGETDLRGVFVAEGIQGTVTAVARSGVAQYAFYRGKAPIGAPPQTAAPATKSEAGESINFDSQLPALEKNVQMLNSGNRMRQLERLQQRYNAPADAAPGVQVDQAR